MAPARFRRGRAGGQHAEGRDAAERRMERSGGLALPRGSPSEVIGVMFDHRILDFYGHCLLITKDYSGDKDESGK